MFPETLFLAAYSSFCLVIHKMTVQGIHTTLIRLQSADEGREVREQCLLCSHHFSWSCGGICAHECVGVAANGNLLLCSDSGFDKAA